jgi:Holliday junction resolvasome RuvABC endonuclease subunit
LLEAEVILAVDPGIGNVGWAIMSRSRVVDLGVWTSTPDSALGKSTDRARRIHSLSLELRRLYRVHGCTIVAAEQALSFGRTSGLIGQALVWGALTMLAAEHGCDLVEVTAKQWQRAVLPDTKAKVDYEQLELKLERYVLTMQGGEAMLMRIHPEQHTHALDAVGVGLFTALRPTTRVTQGRLNR